MRSPPSPPARCPTARSAHCAHQVGLLLNRLLSNMSFIGPLSTWISKQEGRIKKKVSNDHIFYTFHDRVEIIFFLAGVSLQASTSNIVIAAKK